MIPRFLWTFLALGACALSAGCRPLGSDAIPGVKPDGWVFDLSGLLSAEDVAQLERLGDAVHAKEGAELVVVTVDTTGGAEPRRLATGIFNRWQLGEAGRDNGLLIFVAIGDRAAEIVLGDGIDSDAEVAKSDRIMEQELVPRFREGHNAAALVAGARACGAEFFGVADLPVEAVPGVRRALYPRPWRRPHPVAIVILALLGVGSGLLGFGHWHRHHARKCKKCGKKMCRLDEVTDDRYLEPGQAAEEKIGSVDHDVWACLDCEEVQKFAYGKFFTGHHRCPQCANVTASKVEKILRRATVRSTGLMQIDEKCVHCGHQATSTREIPRTPPPSSSSGSSGRSFSSGSSGGGGSSSGRGSSGRW